MKKTNPSFRIVPKTGVIYVMQKASELGFSFDNPEWANLGQGAPEIGDIDNSPERITSIKINPLNQEYAPVAGAKVLREKVAEFYNLMHRKDKESQYTYENVCIAGGGRQALTRIAASLDNINMGHFIPDYTAYEELLSIFRGFNTIPLLLESEKNYRITAKELKSKIMGLGLGAVLLSNPCNPTGQIIQGKELSDWIKVARKNDCTIIFDEFYSHYIYNLKEDEKYKIISAAEYIDDVDSDPIIIVDGLTKNWRYPGWRISWIVAPKNVIEAVSSAASFLDGGANNPFQNQTVELLNPEHAIQETIAIQKHFRKKRDYMFSRLEKMGIVIESKPEGTFYFWANLSKLPSPINNGIKFFEEGIKEKFITVPGIFFDVNPGKRRGFQNAHYQNYCRISFGPELNKLEIGLNSMERMINKFR